MAVIAAPNPLVLKHVVLEVGADDFAAHVSSVTFTPAASTLSWQGLTPDSTFTDVSKATWTVGLTFAQDWTATTSLSRYLFDNEGETVAMEFKPKSGEGPSFTADVTITPGAIGGDVNTVAVGTVTLGSTRPVLVPAA